MEEEGTTTADAAGGESEILEGTTTTTTTFEKNEVEAKGEDGTSDPASNADGEEEANIGVSDSPPRVPSPAEKAKRTNHQNGIVCPPAKKKKEEEEEEAAVVACGAVEDSSDLEFTWICAECREAECLIDPTAPLLICDGPCNRPFHPPCANLSSLPPDDEPWYCADCSQGRHQCAVCKEYGEDGVDVHRCDARGCGLFFHENCLGMCENVEVVTTTSSSSADGERPKFRCPAHECWTCSGGCPPRRMEEEEVANICLPVNDAAAAAAAAAVTPEKAPGGKKKGRGRKRKGGGGTQSSAAMNLWGAKKERLFRCLDCPISYHITCMPPSCRFHELAMLCHEHAYSSKLPYLDAEYSIQAGVEADADKRIEDLKRKEEKARRRSSLEGERGVSAADDDDEEEDEEEENSFLPGLIGSAALFEEDRLAEYLDGQVEEDAESPRKRKKRRQFNYCLPLDFKEVVATKPPSYTHVNANRYDPQNRPKRHPPTGERCHCKLVAAGEGGGADADVGKPACGDRCLNRLSYVECVGDLSLKSGDKNPYWNCDCGPTCGNRAMSQRKFAKCRPSREHGKGWGLITINGVKKGDLVQEYAGEIIDEKTKEKRLKEWSRDHPNDPNFYVMHLEPGWYIDAREVANMARFINHSCDPNCRLVPVNVAGYMRVSIVCIKDVPPGGFLSYDYQFDTQHGEKFICRCGAPCCRGSMMKGSSVEDAAAAKEKKSKKQLFSEAKARVQRDKKFLQSVYASEEERLHLTGPFLPGNDSEKAEMVAAGPQERYRREAQGVFLWRNAIAGGDFSSRYWKFRAREKGKDRPRRQNFAFQCAQLGTTVDVISVMKG